MAQLQTYIHVSSEKGLSSVTTLVVGVKSAILIDPPFLLPDAVSTVSWIKDTTPNPLAAVFVTHHHPDHYFSANAILEAFPKADFFAAPYVRAAIDREYDESVKVWPQVFGKENFPETPRKPEPYPYSFAVLEGNPNSLIMLLGPVQGDCVDHTLFWLPTERIIITGDALYGRSTHVWGVEIETPQVLQAWENVIKLIETLAPSKIIVGHLEVDWELDAQADLEHNKKYLALFRSKITDAKVKPGVQELYTTFKDAFPQADRNVDFFLGHLSNQFGEGGKVSEATKPHNVAARTTEMLEGFRL